MIFIYIALRQEETIKLLEEFEHEVFSYKHVGTEGIQLLFQNKGDALEAAILAKSLIRDQGWGSNLFYGVSYIAKEVVDANLGLGDKLEFV